MTGQARHRADPVPGAVRRQTLLTAVVVAATVGLGSLLALAAGGFEADPAASPSPEGSRAVTAATPSPASSPSPSPSAAAARSARVPADPAATSPSAPAPARTTIGPVDPGVAVTAPLRPVGLSVPAIDLETRLIELGTEADGTLEVPDDPDDAGWFTASAVPGARGPSIIAGHVDSADGVAVFTRLGELAPGDAVAVTLEDGSMAAFVVSSVQQFPKEEFPTDEVYGPSPVPVLRLVTCGGEFDRAAASYRDNVVVEAVPAP
ncbi:class F sortase [Aquipuribacter nitratireducens]|uniref:Class F sortase n=1 Tax=Aquipuribacter nitratireducens TaxID=650104 RepID=A0ABW0GK36_9MICO